MPDQNNPTDTTATPTQVDPPSEPTQMPPIPPAQMDIPAGDASTPPPFPPEVSPPEGTTPPPDSGSAAPSFDIPPVITPNQPSKKFGGKRVIATILGLLVLVGGLGAGVILVRQQQDIREKAYVTECEPGDTASCTTSSGCPGTQTCGTNLKWGSCKDIPGDNCPSVKVADGKCLGPGETCSSGNDYFDPSCSVTETRCGINPGESGLPPCRNTDCNLPTRPAGAIDCSLAGKQTICCPVDKPLYLNGQCVASGGTSGEQCGEFSPVRRTGDSLTVTSGDFNKCQDSCPGGTLWVAKYKCDGINLSQGCQDNGTIEDQLITVEEIDKTFEVGSLSCGTVQIDVGCRNTANTWGSVAFLVKSASTACTTSALPPGDGPTAQCLDVKAFDTNWTQLTTQDLSALKPGDVVRFTVAGQTSSGSFDKARFKINGVQRPEVTGKRPGTEEYYDEYTIPEGITTFTINSQIHHATLGWSN